MHVQIWRSWARLILLEPSGWEYALLALELLLSLTILVASRRGFVGLDRRQFLLFLGCLAAPFLSERFLVVGFPGRNLLPPPGVPVVASKPFTPLCGMLPVVLAGAWLGPASRMLLGRTHLGVNLITERILEGLQWTKARGAGFVVDSRGRIVAHPNPDMLLTTWEIDEGQLRIDSPLRGWAYESRDPQDNTRQLVYYLPVQGYPWAVVVRLPYDVVLEQARQIATPLLGLQILLGGGLVVIMFLITNWVTQPLQQLAVAADRIAEGDLSHPVEIRGLAADGGQDEVARVGIAFEDMRLRLRDRLEDLSLLLELSHSVSATLELPEGLTTELALTDGRTLYANLSAILSAGGQRYQVHATRGTSRRRVVHSASGEGAVGG